ncbi:MAG: hypothetical protein LAO08_18475 [Acidobacteriia bacterium]|nr:hypothetical protein [Terriglobia bacterium]
MARKYMSLDTLSRTVEFRALTVQQQLWTQTYCQSIVDFGAADPVFATQAAFGNAGKNARENARTMSFQLLRNKNVQACLRVFNNFGKSKRDILLNDVRVDIEASRPGSPARAKLREIEAKLIGVKPKGK